MGVVKQLVWFVVPLLALVATADPSQAADPAVQSGATLGNTASRQATLPTGKVLGGSGRSAQQVETMLRQASPMPTPQLAALPADAPGDIQATTTIDAVAPEIVKGAAGSESAADGATETGEATAQPDLAPEVTTGSAITPFDYGRNNLVTVYHYTDRVLHAALNDEYPYRTVGWLRFIAADGGSYRCTAQLIGRSIGITAGHCVHDGGTKGAGWITEGTFAPAYMDGTEPYGATEVYWVNTTAGWYETGVLDQGYDVGIFVLRRRMGTGSELGAFTGYAGFCVANCLQRYWHLTQLGYPANYYNGQRMIEGEHLELSDGRDYVYGSGMQGGSSGGGHFSNLGELDTYSDGSLGYAAARNVIYAVTSWGYSDTAMKVQGASSLSGPDNANDFKELYNSACRLSRTRNGPRSCTVLP